MSSIEKLDWDSQFFGLSIGRLKAATLTEEQLTAIKIQAQQYNFQLLYFFLEELLDFLATGLSTMDGKVLYSKTIEDSGLERPSSIQVYKETTVTPKLYELAIQSGIYSRFKLDPQLPSDAFERLYRTWIEKSVDGQLAEAVLVYRVGEELAGMATLAVKANGWGDIGLLAVDAAHRGQRIGQQLLAAAEQYFAARGINKLGVETQLGNEAACRFYEKNGFREYSREYIYHLWL